MSSNSPGGIYEILGRDLARPENRYLSVPLIRLITSAGCPRKRSRTTRSSAGRSRPGPTCR